MIMKITDQQPTLLTIKTDTDADLTRYAWILVLVSLLILVGFIIGRTTGQIPPLNEIDLVLHSGEQPAEAHVSGGDVFFKLMYRVGRIISNPFRLVVVLALFGLIVGSTILIRPGLSKRITFDTAEQRVTIKGRTWLLRPVVEQYALQNVADIRVERSTAKHGDAIYRAILVLSVSEGVPLTNSYVHSIKVFPFSQAYRYSQPVVQAVVERIHTFLKN